jgi:hypothetical protein
MLDLTTKVHTGGRRRVDVVKEQLVSLASELEPDDALFFWDGRFPVDSYSVGENVARIAMFEPFIPRWNWEVAMNVISSSVVGDGLKLVVLVTDRKHPGDAVFGVSLRWPEAHGVDFLYVFVGQENDKMASTLCEGLGHYCHMQEPGNLKHKILEVLKGQYERANESCGRACEVVDCTGQEG